MKNWSSAGQPGGVVALVVTPLGVTMTTAGYTSNITRSFARLRDALAYMRDNIQPAAFAPDGLGGGTAYCVVVTYEGNVNLPWCEQGTDA